MKDIKKEIKEELEQTYQERIEQDKNLKAEILAMKDTSKRQKLIQENIRLFKNQIGGR